MIDLLRQSLVVWIATWIAGCQTRGIIQADAPAKKALKAHNMFRSIHGVPDLILDDNMTSEAQSYAEELSALGTLKRSNSRDGENLAFGCMEGDQGLTPGDATRMWYKEVCDSDFDFEKGQGSGIVKHFFQVIWKESKDFGFGLSNAKNDKENKTCTALVGRYRPPAEDYRNDSVLEGDFSKGICKRLRDMLSNLEQNGKDDEIETNKYNEIANGDNGNEGDTALPDDAQVVIAAAVAGAKAGGEAGAKAGMKSGNEKKAATQAEKVGEKLGKETGESVTDNIGDNSSNADGGNASNGGDQTRDENVLYSSQPPSVENTGADSGESKSVDMQKILEAAQQVGTEAGKKAAEGLGVNGGKGNDEEKMQKVVEEAAQEGSKAGQEAGQEAGKQVAEKIKTRKHRKKAFLHHRHTAGMSIRNINKLLTTSRKSYPGQRQVYELELQEPVEKPQPLIREFAKLPSFYYKNHAKLADASVGLKQGKTASYDNIASAQTDKQADLKAAAIAGARAGAEAGAAAAAKAAAEALGEAGAGENQDDSQNAQNAAGETPDNSKNIQEAGEEGAKQGAEAGKNAGEKAGEEVAKKNGGDEALSKAAKEAGAKAGAMAGAQAGAQAAVEGVGGSQDDVKEAVEKAKNLQEGDGNQGDTSAGNNNGNSGPGPEGGDTTQGANAGQDGSQGAGGGAGGGGGDQPTKEEKQELKEGTTEQGAGSEVERKPDKVEEPGNKEAGTFEQQALDAHNKYRQVHDAPQMKLNDELNKDAADYAKVIAAKGTLEHAKNNKDGENLAMQCNSPGDKEKSGLFFTKMWYDEVCEPGYDFQNGGFGMGTGHFTQVVWKGSTELGIGKATGKSGQWDCTFVVGRYRPPGNYEGKFQEEVKKGSFDKATMCKNGETPKRHHISSKPFVRVYETPLKIKPGVVYVL